jgi:hypothetical protein
VTILSSNFLSFLWSSLQLQLQFFLPLLLRG